MLLVMRRKSLTARSQINVGHHSVADRSGRVLTHTHDHKNFQISKLRSNLRALLFLLGDFAHYHSQITRDTIQSDGHALRTRVEQEHNLAD